MYQASPFARTALLLSFAVYVTALAPAAAQDGAAVNAGQPSSQQLRAPAERESFDFMIFGDRTGGPPEGVEVLEQGVVMANRLDVDLVVTVGDLVEGYNEPEKWLAQMREYKAAMEGLAMPWYPVAGNHDVYARPNRPGGNTDLYARHFGPLYYSFDYKWAHFIVLFSDEALAFGNPAKDQNFSQEQMDWLRKDLAASKAGQVFVFLHHPRWTKRYAGCNWDDVHAMFVEDGRPVTVFAGHIHLYRSDGWIDNVRYYTLATTGGHLGRYRESAALHHVDFVRVRPERVTVAALPIGCVLGGDFVLGSELDAMDELSRGDWLSLKGTASVGLRQGERSSFAVTLANPTDGALRLTAEIKASYGWSLDCQPVDREVPAGDALTLNVRATAPALSAAEPHISVRAALHYRLRSGLVQPINVRTNVPIRAVLPKDTAAAKPDDNGVLVLDGASAVRIEVPERLERYTLECWVRGTEPKGSSALLAKTESSAYGIYWSDNAEGGTLPTGFVGTTQGYLTLPAKEAWDWDRWTHLALVFDGKRATLFVNGEPQTQKTTDAAATHNRHPLYVGADPDGRGNPGRYFSGAIDEVRLSGVPRYDGRFTAQRVFERDAQTLVLLHFDESLGALFGDDSGTEHHGWGRGKPKILRMQR